MPRNASGTYTLPEGNPVVDGTVVDPEWANTTLADIGNELTNSMPRDGAGALTGPLKAADGSEAAPSITFGADPDNGLWRSGADDWRASAGGSEVQRWTPAGARFVTDARFDAQALLDDGSAAAPALTFTDDLDSGLYRVGDDSVGMAAGGAQIQRWDDDGSTFSLGVTVQAAATGAGVTATGGSTSGTGVKGTGGAAGEVGVQGYGGATDGTGVEGYGAGDGTAGVGVEGTGATGVKGTGSTQGVEGVGSSGGHGVKGTGNSSGSGVLGVGGALSPGVSGQGVGGSQPGVKGTSNSANGVEGIAGGSTGGIYGVLGTSNTAHVDSFGVAGIGGTSTDSGSGVYGYGLGTGAAGGKFEGGTDAHGAILVGNSSRAPLRLTGLASAPSAPVSGAVYFDSTEGVFYGYDGSDWRTLSSPRSVLAAAADTISPGATTYAVPGATENATERAVPVPTAGTISNLRVAGSTAFADTTVVTVRKNGSDTAVTCTVSSGSGLGSDTANDVSFAAGDLLSFSIVTTGGSSAPDYLRISVELAT